MRTGRRSASRRRPQSRAARIAVPLAIPMALGLTLGDSPDGHRRAFEHDDSAVGRARARPRPRVRVRCGRKPLGLGVTGGRVRVASSATVTPAATATATAAAATAAANVNCDIIVPANPLTAQGLATPYQLTGPNGMTPAQSGCTMANAANLGAFVQATILNPATGQLSVYDPLVITQGTTPAASRRADAARRARSSRSTSGSTARNLTQVGATATPSRGGHCVNGQAGRSSGRCRSATAPTSSTLPRRPRPRASWSCRRRAPPTRSSRLALPDHPVVHR